MGPGSAMARAERWRSPGAHPDDLPKGYQLAPGGKRGNVRSRDQRGLPPGSELIGLRQVDGMAQREPCRGSEQPERTP